MTCIINYCIVGMGTLVGVVSLLALTVALNVTTVD